MKLTNFRKLRNAIAAIDLNFVVNGVAELHKLLSGRGLEFSKRDVVITQEGIYYINPGTGMTVKVALYQGQQWLKSENVQMRYVDQNGYEEQEEIEVFNKYHLVRCNLLTQYELQRWPEGFRVCHRSDGRFYHRLLATLGEGKKRENFHQDLDNQRLEICKNCLIKINTMLSEEKDVFDTKTFEPKYFFSSGFQATWQDKTRPSTNERGIDSIHPKDLAEIVNKRRAQAEYICELCDIDLSRPELQRYCCVQYTDHLNDNISYMRLRCLCVACAEDQPTGNTLGETPDVDEFLRVLRGYLPEAQ